jgi:hypothetical protein
LAGVIDETERSGYLIQLGSNSTPTATITTSFSLGAVPGPPPGFVSRPSFRQLLRRI